MTQRTTQQNAGFWLGCDLLASALNDAGFDLSAAIEQGLLKNAVPWTQQNIADVMARPIMKALWPDGPGKDWINPDRPSTRELSTTQIGEVWEIMNRATATKFGVQIPFPSEESK